MSDEDNRQSVTLRCARIFTNDLASHNFAFVARDDGSCLGCQLPFSPEEPEEVIIQGPHWVRPG